MANKLPAEIIELMGQLRLLNTIASRMADDANDAWCEEGMGWSEREVDWCQRAEKMLEEIMELSCAVIQHGAAL